MLQAKQLQWEDYSFMPYKEVETFNVITLMRTIAESLQFGHVKQYKILESLENDILSYCAFYCDDYKVGYADTLEECIKLCQEDLEENWYQMTDFTGKEYATNTDN